MVVVNIDDLIGEWNCGMAVADGMVGWRGWNGQMAEMATYVLFMVHTDDTDTDTDTNTDTDDDTLIFYSIDN